MISWVSASSLLLRLWSAELLQVDWFSYQSRDQLSFIASWLPQLFKLSSAAQALISSLAVDSSNDSGSGDQMSYCKLTASITQAMVSFVTASWQLQLLRQWSCELQKVDCLSDSNCEQLGCCKLTATQAMINWATATWQLQQLRQWSLSYCK